MGDGSEFTGGNITTPLIYNKVDYNIDNNFMNETGVFQAPQGNTVEALFLFICVC